VITSGNYKTKSRKVNRQGRSMLRTLLEIGEGD